MKTPTIKTSILALGLATATVSASTVVYEFDGSLDFGLTSPDLISPPILPPGTGFAGHFSYDTSAPPLFTSPTFSTYELTDLHLTFNPGSVPETVILVGGTIDITNDPVTGDRFDINAGQTLPPVFSVIGGQPLDFHGISLFYEDASGTIFPDSSLPGPGLTEADFPPSGSYVFGYSFPGEAFPFLADGNLDNLRTSAIPEPSSALLLLGAVGFGMFRRRR